MPIYLNNVRRDKYGKIAVAYLNYIHSKLKFSYGNILIDFNQDTDAIF